MSIRFTLHRQFACSSVRTIGPCRSSTDTCYCVEFNEPLVLGMQDHTLHADHLHVEVQAIAPAMHGLLVSEHAPPPLWWVFGGWETEPVLPSEPSLPKCTPPQSKGAGCGVPQLGDQKEGLENAYSEQPQPV